MAQANQAQAAELVSQMRKLLDGVDIFTGMAALQHVTIDVIVSLGVPLSKQCALEGVDAVAADMRSVIEQRFAATGPAH